MLIGTNIINLISVPLKKYDLLISKTAEAIRDEWPKASEVLINGIRNHFFLSVYGFISKEKETGKNILNKFYDKVDAYNFSCALKLSIPSAIGVFIICILSYVSITYFHTAGPILISFFYLFLRFVQSGSEAYSGLGEVRLLMSNMKQLYLWQTSLNQKSNPIFETEKLSQSTITDLEKSFLTQGVSIECKNVSFKFDSINHWILKNISFSLNKGDCLVISGESGAGKSTLLSLILGLNQPTEGEILVNHHKISEIRSQLFEQIGYVGPEPYLIQGTVLDNLLYGHPKPSEISLNKIQSALKISNAFEFVMNLPQKEKAFLNEQAKISTGQKQRLSIARVLLRNPKMIILDECTSNLDYQNELEIIKSIEQLKNQMTTIIVSHRPNFMSLATQTIDLSKDKHKDGETTP
jgi:ABC-type multidrug transport system fused ATPase/permease subunit